MNKDEFRKTDCTFREIQTTLAILGMIGIATVLLSTRYYGAGLSPDSVGYIAAARHIASGIGVVTYDGTPLLVQPPLYPALLAAMEFVFGIDPLSSARVINAVLFGLIVYLSGLLFTKHFESFALVVLGTASVLVAVPLIQVSLMAWSEPLFICFTLLYLILSESYLAKGDTASLLLLSLSVALACLARYIGVVLILTGVVSILLFRRDSPRVNFRHLFLFISLSALPIGVWVIRNYLLSGTLFGPRASSIYTLSTNATFAFNTFVSWYIPQRISEHRSLLMLLTATISFLAGLSIRGDWAKVRSVLLEIGLLLLFIIAYVGFLLVSSTTIAYDAIGDRLLSPVFVPITLLLLFLASKMVTSLMEQRLTQKRANVLLAVAIVGWLVYPVSAAMSSITNAMSQGQGYSSESWRNSQTIEYLRENRTLECEIYSNGPDALYILANRTAKMSPVRTMYNSPEVVNDISNLRSSWPEKRNACLVWFDMIGRQYLFTIDELQTIADVQQLIRLEDGAIYSVTRK